MGEVRAEDEQWVIVHWTTVCTQVRTEGSGQFIRVKDGQFRVEGGIGVWEIVHCGTNCLYPG